MARVKINIDGDSSGFTNAIKGVEHSVNQIKGLIAVQLAQEAAAALIEMSEKVLTYGAGLVDVARKTGMTIEQVQVLKKVAEESGTEFEALGKAIGKVAILRDAALKGDKEALSKLKALGVDTDKKHLNNTNSGDILMKEIGDKVKGSNFDTIAKPLADALGKNFQEVIPALKTDIDETRESMKSMGEIMDTKTAVSCKVLETEFHTLSNMLVTVVAPALIFVIRTLETVANKFLHFIFPNTQEEGQLHKSAKSGFFQAIGNAIIPGGGTMGQLLGKGLDKGTDLLSDKYSPATKMDEFLRVQDEMIKKLMDELNGNTKPGVPPIIPDVSKPVKEHGKAAYSDNLTSSGNMLGASFNNLPQLTQQMQLQKQGNEELKRHGEYLLQQLAVLSALTKVTNPFSVFN